MNVAGRIQKGKPQNEKDGILPWQILSQQSNCPKNYLGKIV